MISSDKVYSFECLQKGEWLPCTMNMLVAGDVFRRRNPDGTLYVDALNRSTWRVDHPMDMTFEPFTIEPEEKVYTDTERLDFILKEMAFITTAAKGYQLWKQDEDENFYTSNLLFYETPRQAIDAAIEFGFSDVPINT